MQKKVSFVLANVVLLILTLLGWKYYLDEEALLTEQIAAEPNDIVKTIRYQFRVQNTSNEVIKNSQFVVYAPAHVMGRQEVLSLSANREFELNEMPLGNRSLMFTLDVLPPYASKQIVITAKLKVFDGAVSVVLADELRTKFLQEEPFIEVSHPAITAQAKLLAKGTEQPFGNTIYKWLTDNVKDIGLVSANKGALYALQNQKGDCTEFMYLFSALARAEQVPTRNLGGFVLPQNGLLTASDYHNWAEYYDGNRWRIVDAQRQVFDQGYDSYIIMRILGLNEAQDDFSQSQRFLAFDPRLKVSMD
jgi:transglutaminase-like putative cysteine protease